MKSFPDAAMFHDPDVPQSPFEQFRGQLRAHPESEKAEDSQGLFDKFDLKARYRMFDLTQQSEVEDLQDVMTDVMYGRKILREEKWSHDKDACTTVTLAWLDKIPKKTKKKDDEDAPGIPDGEHPGEGTAEPDFSDSM